MRACHPASKTGDRVSKQRFPRPTLRLSRSAITVLPACLLQSKQGRLHRVSVM